MKKEIVRYYTKTGWHHATVIKLGRNWAKLRDLGIHHRRRTVRISDVQEALWQTN